MARKIRFHSLHILFRLFAFLADKTGGWHLFVKPKMILGSLLLGVGLTTGGIAQTQKQRSGNQSDKKTNQVVSTKRTSNTKASSSKNNVTEAKEDTVVYVKQELISEIKGSCYETVIPISTDSVFEVVEQMPRFPGGEEALFLFIKENLRYPVNTDESKIEGTVVVRFVVKENGEVNRPEIIRSLEFPYDKEAVRLIKSFPKWIPGKRNGKNVAVWYTLPIKYGQKKEIQQQAVDSNYAYTKVDSNYVYTKVERMPQFPGGWNALFDFIRNKKEPQILVQCYSGITGNIICKFIVEKDGSLNEIKVIKGIDPDLDKKAVKIINEMPRWIPGQENGKKVRVYVTLPIDLKY